MTRQKEKSCWTVWTFKNTITTNICLYFPSYFRISACYPLNSGKNATAPLFPLYSYKNLFSAGKRRRQIIISSWPESISPYNNYHRLSHSGTCLAHHTFQRSIPPQIHNPAAPEAIPRISLYLHPAGHWAEPLYREKQPMWMPGFPNHLSMKLLVSAVRKF